MRAAIPPTSSDNYHLSYATNATVSPSRSRWPYATIKLSAIIVAVSACALISKIHDMTFHSFVALLSVPTNDAFIALGVFGVVLAIVSVIALCRIGKTRNGDFARVPAFTVSDPTAVSSLTTTHKLGASSQWPTAQQVSIPADATSGVTTATLSDAAQSLPSNQQINASTISAVPAVPVDCEPVIPTATLAC